MATLTKNGGTKTLDNEALIARLISEGWVLVVAEESVEETPIKEVKNGKTRTTNSK